MSHSSSDSEEDPIVRLSDILTVAAQYEKGKIKPNKTTPRHTANATFLTRVSLFQGDITAMEVDSIVNAANRSLLGGGGVDGAIHSAGLTEFSFFIGCLLKSSGTATTRRMQVSFTHPTFPRLIRAKGETLGGCDTGGAKITKAYKLPSKHIIHAVGPVYSRSDVENRAKQLASCYKTSLDIAVENGLKHIAFPSISTGIYGYPIVDATHIALETVHQFCESEHGGKLDRIIFVVWSNKDKEVYETLIPEYFPLEEESTTNEPAEQQPVSEELSQLPDAPEEAS
ncbi:Macro domain-containing protein [Mycena indigotica]|uniref:Macro domain-containing protein n=1 Tax=Mycena indigotica TaxID=2126181 RepID=A0A8H6T951_9AGAR|nr:Macro domain-containing protein [Mycena indigotica]KAF7312237.1 Macro domain-containing protein [Mycena indigotica]